MQPRQLQNCVFGVRLLYAQQYFTLQAANNRQINKTFLKYTVKNTVICATLPYFSQIEKHLHIAF
jgi:hypothetical protein